MARILLHRIQDGFRLETCRFQRRSRYMSLLRMRCDTEHRPLGRIDPVRRKEAAERSDEDDAAIVRHGLCQGGYFVGFVREAEVVHQKLNGGARDRD
jgi:hypothetical protein